MAYKSKFFQSGAQKTAVGTSGLKPAETRQAAATELWQRASPSQTVIPETSPAAQSSKADPLGRTVLGKRAGAAQTDPMGLTLPVVETLGFSSGGSRTVDQLAFQHAHEASGLPEAAAPAALDRAIAEQEKTIQEGINRAAELLDVDPAEYDRVQEQNRAAKQRLTELQSQRYELGQSQTRAALEKVSGSADFQTVADQVIQSGGIWESGVTSQAPKYKQLRQTVNFIKSEARGDETLAQAAKEAAGLPLEYMSDTQKQVIAYYVGMGDYDSAAEYLEIIGRDLNQSGAEQFNSAMSQWAEEHPFQAAAANMAAWPLAIPAYVENTKQAVKNRLTGEYTPTDYNSQAFLGAQIGNQTSAGVQAAARNAAVQTFGNETAGNVAAFLAGTGLSIGQNASQIMLLGPYSLAGMSISAAGSATLDALERGATAEQAFLIGTAGGAIEAATEKLPLENLMRIAGGGGKGVVKNLLKQMGTEASEEMISEIANNLVDTAVMGDSSQFKTYVQELRNAGMTGDEAEKQAFLQFYIYNVLLSGLGGALSGGVMAGGASLFAQAGQYSSQLQDGKDSQAISQAYQAMMDKGMFDPEARYAAGEAAVAVDQARELELPYIAQAVQEDQGKAQGWAPGAGQSAANTEQGQMEPEPPYIPPAEQNKAASTGETARGETARLVEKLKNSIPQVSADEVVASVSTDVFQTVPGNGIVEKARALFEKIKGTVTRSGFGDVEISGRSVKDDLSHGIGPAKAAVIPSIPEVVRKGRQIDYQNNWKGRNYDTYVFAAPVNMDGDTVYVAAVVKQTSKNRFYLHEVVDSNGNIIKIDNTPDVIQTSLAAKDGAGHREVLPTETIPQAGGSVKAEGYAQEAVTDGRLTLDRVASREDARYIYRMAKAAGVNVEIAPAQEGRNGWYENGTIYITENAGDPAVVVAKHEVTHHLQQAAPEAYAEYRDYVAKFYENELEQGLARLQEVYASHGVELTRDEALDDLAADFTERLLIDEHVFQELAQENRGLAQRLLDALRSLLGKIRSAFSGKVTQETSELERAARLWEQALRESAGAQVGETGRRYSIDPDYTGDVDAWDAEGRPDGEVFILGATGEVLQGLGAMEQDIFLRSEKVNAILQKHPEMTMDAIKRIPEILDDPVLVLKSRNVGRGNMQNTRLVLFGTVRAENGQPVMTVLDLRPVEGRLVIDDMQKVNSAYTRSNAANYTQNSEVLYADEKRTIPLLRSFAAKANQSSSSSYRLAHTGSVGLLRSGYMGSISYNGNNVNLEGTPFSDVVGAEPEGLSLPTLDDDAAIADGADDIVNLQTTAINEKKLAQTAATSKDGISHRTPASTSANSISQNGTESNSEFTGELELPYVDNSSPDASGRYSSETLQDAANRDKMGETRYSLEEDLKNGRAREEDREAFLRRIDSEGLTGFEGDSIAYGYRPGQPLRGGDSGLAGQVQEELTRLGADNSSPDTSGRQYSIQGSRDVMDELADLRRQNKRLEEKNAWYKSQFKRTGARLAEGITDQESVRRAAREMLSDYSSRYDKTELYSRLQNLYDEMARQGSFDQEGASAMTEAELRREARSIANDVIRESAAVDDELYRQYKDLRDYLRETRINVPQELYAELGGKEGYDEFRKRNTGRMRLSSKEGDSINSVYQELSLDYPELFNLDDAAAPAEQLERMAQVLDDLRPVYENPFSDTEQAAAAEYLAGEIMERFYDLPQQKPTFADRQEQRAQRMAEKQRERAVERQQKKLERYKEQQREVRRNQSERRQRADLLKIAQRLSSRKMDKASRAMLDEVIGDLDTVSQKLTGKTVEKLEGLRDWYYRECETNKDFIPDEKVKKSIERLTKTHISDFTIEEVRDLTKILRHIENEIYNSKRLIDTEDRRDIYQQGSAVIESMEKMRPGRTGVVGRFITSETLSPVRQLRRMTGYDDANPLMRATNALADGQRSMLDYQMKAERPFQKFAEDKAFQKSFSGKQAEQIEISGIGKDGPATAVITPAMRASLYLHSRNNQNLRHIAEGGVTVPDAKLYRQGKISEAYDKGTTIKLEPSQVTAIVENMTAQEKAFAEQAHRYFNEVSPKAINEVSEKLKGYDIAEVKNYFPINSNTDFTHGDFEAVKHDGSIEGMGFLKERTEAAGPILLRDVNEVLEQSIRMNSKYVGLAIPVRNFNKIWAVTTTNVNDAGETVRYADSVRRAVKNQWGETGAKYIEKMMADIQGASRDTSVWAKALGRVRSSYAGAVLTLNAGVAMKQAASYPTAAAVLGWKPLAQAMGSVGKVDLELIEKYTPLQWYRSKGFSTRELGDMSSANKQLPKVLNWIQGVDLATTRKLWKASEYYVQDNQRGLKTGTDDYYKAVADVYNRVIEETQPNYTTMQRPQLLRSNDSLLSSVAMFKTQPFQNFNVLYDAAGDLEAKSRKYKETGSNADLTALKKARKNMGRAVTSQAAQLAVFAGMTMAWALLRGKKDKYSDEDGEMSLETMLKGLGKDIAGGLFSIVPFGSDAWEALSSGIFGERYYGMESVGLSTVSDTVSAVIDMADTIGGAVKTVAAGEKLNVHALLLDIDGFADDLSKIAGIPYENVANLLYAMVRAPVLKVRGEYLGEYEMLDWTTDRESDAKAYYDILYQAMNGDWDQYTAIYNDMVDSGMGPEEIADAMDRRMADEAELASTLMLPERFSPPGESETFDEYVRGAIKTREGLENQYGSDYLELARDVDALEPEEGKDRVSNAQRRWEIANSPFDEDTKELAMEKVLDDTAYETYLKAREAGVSTLDFVDAYEATGLSGGTFDRYLTAVRAGVSTQNFVELYQSIREAREARGSTSTSQADVETALNKSGLTRAQKKAIWDSYGWKGESPWG